MLPSSVHLSHDLDVITFLNYFSIAIIINTVQYEKGVSLEAITEVNCEWCMLSYYIPQERVCLMENVTLL